MSHQRGKTAFLILKKPYFEAIARGDKTSECRLASPYWIDRLDNEVTKVLFQLGRGNGGHTPKRMRFKVKEVRVLDTIHNLDIPYPNSVKDIPKGFRACLIEIKLAKRLE